MDRHWHNINTKLKKQKLLVDLKLSKSRNMKQQSTVKLQSYFLHGKQAEKKPLNYLLL
jgi:hypothetical protein